MRMLTRKKKRKAYELQMLGIGDAAEEHVDLPHREHTLQTTSHDVLD